MHIHIAKDIPVAGGMAGGSAGRSGALLACDELWGTESSLPELLAICAELGSDVPFSLVGGAALGTGRGENLSPLEVGGTFHWVFAVADGGLSTPAVYGEFDRLTAGTEVPPPVASPALLEALRTGDATALAGALVNDLQPAALSLRPSLAATLAAGHGGGRPGGPGLGLGADDGVPDEGRGVGGGGGRGPHRLGHLPHGTGGPVPGAGRDGTAVNLVNLPGVIPGFPSSASRQVVWARARSAPGGAAALPS